mmetsp:Transcript_83012/g.173804  ORF Transcript_83012/g.173804 Transcript_83012/m.173804 type:complete len:323 (-) Transcript_83012:687-1655(-)
MLVAGITNGPVPQRNHHRDHEEAAMEALLIQFHLQLLLPLPTMVLCRPAKLARTCVRGGHLHWMLRPSMLLQKLEQSLRTRFCRSWKNRVHLCATRQGMCSELVRTACGMLASSPLGHLCHRSHQGRLYLRHLCLHRYMHLRVDSLVSPLSWQNMDLRLMQMPQRHCGSCRPMARTPFCQTWTARVGPFGTSRPTSCVRSSTSSKNKEIKVGVMSRLQAMKTADIMAIAMTQTPRIPEHILGMVGLTAGNAMATATIPSRASMIGPVRLCRIYHPRSLNQFWANCAIWEDRFTIHQPMCRRQLPMPERKRAKVNLHGARRRR